MGEEEPLVKISFSVEGTSHAWIPGSNAVAAYRTISMMQT